jgi:hypothetical protein
VRLLCAAQSAIAAELPCGGCKAINTLITLEEHPGGGWAESEAKPAQQASVGLGGCRPATKHKMPPGKQLSGVFVAQNPPPEAVALQSCIIRRRTRKVEQGRRARADCAGSCTSPSRADGCPRLLQQLSNYYCNKSLAVPI